MTCRDRPSRQPAGRVGAADRGLDRGLGGAAGGRRLGTVITIFFALFLVPVGVSIVQENRPAAVIAVNLTCLVLYGLTYLLTTRLWICSLAVKLAVTGWMLALATVLVALNGLDAMTLYTYAVAVPAFMLPLRWAVGIDGGLVAALGLLVAVRADRAQHAGSWLGLLAVTATMILMGMLFRIVRELHQARHELAEVAVAEERNRVARDLHDVLGHSLTTVTVKATLAHRLLAADPPDLVRAGAEVADIERLSRAALAEVRATVSGYRRASLAAELAGAKEALASADIRAELPRAIDEVRPELREPFAYVLREGVTNVLRHSNARTCRVRLGESWLEIADDGTGTGTADGHGLAGLRERLGAVGAGLRAERLPEGGFLLRAAVEPAP